MAINTIFSERLNLLMKERGVTQTTLSDAVGITKQSISMYSNAHRVPDIEVFKKICDFFEVSADYLLGTSDIKSFDIDNVGINKKLGLSDEVITVIELIKRKDEFLGIDFFNYFISEPFFIDLFMLIREYMVNLAKNTLVDNSFFRKYITENNLIISDEELVERRENAFNYDDRSDCMHALNLQKKAKKIYDDRGYLSYKINEAIGDVLYNATIENLEELQFNKEVKEILDLFWDKKTEEFE